MSRRVELDVRHYHQEGREPFADIMSAVSDLEPGDSLVLRNTFEPAPLYAVLASRGFIHSVSKAAEDDWFITFTRA